MQPTSEEILTLARTYGLVTPGTSLLVLETLEQYLTHRIAPPASLPEMRAAYDTRIEETAREEEQRRAVHLDRVVDMWQQRVQWWEQEFDYSPNEASAHRSAMEAAPERSRGHADGPDDSIIVGGPPFAPRSAAERFARNPGSDGGFDSEFAAIEVCASLDVSGEVDRPSAAGAIHIKPWTPETPYLTAMRQAAAADTYVVYLRQRQEYAASPAFFLDCADYLLSCGSTELGIRVLTNLLESGLVSNLTRQNAAR
jgi:hypothetical protein